MLQYKQYYEDLLLKQSDFYPEIAELIEEQRRLHQKKQAQAEQKMHGGPEQPEMFGPLGGMAQQPIPTQSTQNQTFSSSENL